MLSSGTVLLMDDRGAEPEPFLTLREAAGRLRVSDSTIRRMVKGRNLPATRIGGQWRVSRADLAAYIARHRQAGRGEAEDQPTD